MLSKWLRLIGDWFVSLGASPQTNRFSGSSS